MSNQTSVLPNRSKKTRLSGGLRILGNIRDSRQTLSTCSVLAQCLLSACSVLAQYLPRVHHRPSGREEPHWCHDVVTASCSVHSVWHGLASSGHFGQATCYLAQELGIRNHRGGEILVGLRDFRWRHYSTSTAQIAFRARLVDQRCPVRQDRPGKIGQGAGSRCRALS